MTEINGKKYYTFDEIRAMPLGTKFKMEDLDGFIYLYRDSRGYIEISSHDQRLACTVNPWWFIQDRFELVEDKPEREYVTGCQALEKLIRREWEKITSADHKDWMMEDFIKLSDCGEYFVNKNGEPLLNVEIFEPRFLKLKKWYEYKD